MDNPTTDNDQLDNKPLDRAGLKTASLNGAAINMISQIIKFGLLFLNQVVMARFLTPADFGLVAMVGPVMAFIVMFADLGLSQATIQRQKITQQEQSFLFWTNFGVATTLALIVMLISPLVALFYDEPRVLWITLIMGSTLIISGLTSQHIAIFTRNMEFKKLVLLDLGALVVGFTAGYIAAIMGMDYWSLVVIHVTIYLTNLVTTWMFSTWRPSKPSLPPQWRELLGFGGNLSGFNFVNYFARNLDNILIGRVNGEVALGLYDRAYKLLLMPLTQITQPFSRIALPLLSRTLSEPETYKKAYLRMVEVIMLITYPGVLYAVIDHDNLIVTVLGERWKEVGPIFAILGIGSFFAALSHSTGWLFVSQNRTREMRNWGVFSSALFITSFIVGLPWGPLGVAACYVGVGFIQAPVLWWASTRSGPVKFSDMIKSFIPYVVSLAATGICLYLMAHYVLPKGLLAIIIMLPLSYLIFGAVFMLMPSGRVIIKELYKHAFSMFAPFLARYFPRKDKIEDGVI